MITRGGGKKSAATILMVSYIRILLLNLIIIIIIVVGVFLAAPRISRGSRDRLKFGEFSIDMVS